MYSTSDFRKGLKVEIDGAPYVMVENQFVKPGKGQAFHRVRLKHMITGAVLDRTFKSGETVGKADVSEEKMQYLYEADGQYHFMNTTTYEQVAVALEELGDTKNYLTENLECSILLWNGRPVAVEPPTFVELQITSCDPGIRGDTVTGASKPATLTTGYILQVPLFVEQDEWIRIDTRTGQYLDRAKR